MIRKEYIVFRDDDVYSDDNMVQARECLLEEQNVDDRGMVVSTDVYGYPRYMTKLEFIQQLDNDAVMERAQLNNDLWRSDEEKMLNDCIYHTVHDNGIAIFATIGCWNGNKRVARENCYSASKILCSGEDYTILYVDGNGDLRKTGTHHDGTNTYLYRYWKSGISKRQKLNLFCKWISGDMTRADLSRCTVALGSDIAEIYGWKVRGSKRGGHND